MEEMEKKEVVTNHVGLQDIEDKGLVNLMKTDASANFFSWFSFYSTTEDNTPTSTFITQQAPVSEAASSRMVLPDIQVLPPQPDKSSQQLRNN